MPLITSDGEEEISDGTKEAIEAIRELREMHRQMYLTSPFYRATIRHKLQKRKEKQEGESQFNLPD